MRDIHTGTASSRPCPFGQIGDRLIFEAEDAAHGRELWSSDGTAGGTSFLGDIGPGTSDYRPAAFAWTPRKLFLIARRESEVWVTDGKPEGTILLYRAESVKEIVKLEAAGELAFFFVGEPYTGDESWELWRTDGTPAGTFKLLELQPWYQRNAMAELGGVLYFQGDDDENGTQLWKTDGTVAGTVPVLDLVPGPDNYDFSKVASHGGLLYFDGDDGTHRGLWSSDGTEEGTSFVSEIRVRGEHAGWYGMIPAGNLLYLEVYDIENGWEVWRTDGTGEGTWRAGTFFDERRHRPSGYTALGDRLFLNFRDPETRLAVWATDGTRDSAIRLREGYGPFARFRGELVFQSCDDTHGCELWTTDGTPENTRVLLDLSPGPESSYAACPEPAFGDLFFRAETPMIGQELWRTDLTPEGTRLVMDVSTDGLGSDPRWPTPLGGSVFFTADDGTHGRELWVTDGTGVGTHRLTDVVTGVGDSVPDRQLVAAGGVVFFVVTFDYYRYELWRSDGTVEGTFPVHGQDPEEPMTLEPDHLTAAGSLLFFVGFDAHHGYELWRSDGTLEGTRLVRDLREGPDGPGLSSFGVAGSTLYFAADVGGAGDWQLWRSDGTAEGTLQLTENQAGLRPEPVGVAGGLYFYETLDDDGNWLSVSDGTIAGTRGFSPVRGDDGVELNGELVFAGGFEDRGVELGRSDATAEGTVLVRDIRRGRLGSFPDLIGPVGENRALFFADNELFGREIWRTDGTTVGTRVLADLEPGPGDLRIGPGVLMGRLLLSSKADPLLGWELWMLDTDDPLGGASTIDVRPGPESSGPERLARVGDILFFTADDGVHGREPWILRIPPEMRVQNIWTPERDAGTHLARVPVELSHTSARIQEVDFETADGAAMAGSDYAPAEGRLAIPPGQQRGWVDVEIFGDTDVEADESFAVRLNHAPDALLMDSLAEVTILTDDFEQGSCGHPRQVDIHHRTFDSAESFTACNTVRARLSSLAPSADVMLVGGKRVVLGDGFVVEPGAKLRVEIDPDLDP